MFDQKARLVALIGAGLLLAACGDDAAPGGSNGGSSGSAAGGVVAKDHPELGKVLTDSKGMTLYFTDQEADGTIRCVEGCLSIWSPVMMDSAPSGVADGLGVTDRESSGKQLTFEGKPLYTFRLDPGAGEVTGHNVEDDFSGIHFVWRAAIVGGQPAGGESPATTTSGDGYGY